MPYRISAQELRKRMSTDLTSLPRIDASARCLTKRCGTNVSIGAFSYIDENVELGNDVTVHPHCVIYGPARLGDKVEVFPFAFIGKAPASSASLSKPSAVSEAVVVGEGTVVSPGAVIYLSTVIGKDCLIGDAASIREHVRVGDSVIIGRHVTIGPKVTVGNHTRIVDFAHITGDTSIGERVFVSTHVCSANDNSFASSRDVSLKGPSIGDDVKIGLGAVLLPGITIGDGAVVGAGAIVTRDVPSKRLVMGQPAKVVRELD
jgi:acetyltransferase-like isoleucine patch superfamily enzyme